MLSDDFSCTVRREVHGIALAYVWDSGGASITEVRVQELVTSPDEEMLSANARMLASARMGRLGYSESSALAENAQSLHGTVLTMSPLQAVS